MTPTEATYTVYVEHLDDHKKVTISYQGRPISRRTVKTLGHCGSLGLFLCDPDSPSSPVAEIGEDG